MASSFVVPGEQIYAEQGYLRGHGTYIVQASDGPQLLASNAGDIHRVDKLISVHPLNSRFSGEVGDLIVGRITCVESKRWKVDINSSKDAHLQLSSVNLPGGAQRIRTYEDQLQMRQLFTENDLISAEIQNISSDGTASIHTRSLKYGKLENGQLIVVPASLIKRLPQHYVSLPWGIDILLGMNGYIWITRSIPEEWRIQQDIDDDITLAETLQELKRRHADTKISVEDRLKISRVRNVVYILGQAVMMVTPEAITSIYQRSLSLGIEPKDMLHPATMTTLIQYLKATKEDYTSELDMEYYSSSTSTK